MWEIFNPHVASAGGLGMERLVEKEGLLLGIFLELNLEAQMALAR